jgi:hypothetical protein
MASPLTLDEIAMADVEIFGHIEAIAGRIVICSDNTQLSVLPGDLANAIARAFRGHNAAIERSAILVASSSPTRVLQTGRVVAESESPNRRCFRVAQDAIAWLSPLLTEAETARLCRFFQVPQGHGLDLSLT